MWVNKELNNSDAFVAAWLPGTEGDGIAEVLFGRTHAGKKIDFKGKLSFSWPREADNTNLNRNTSYYDPLFPFGYGLSYEDDTYLEILPETLPDQRKLKLGEIFLQGWPSEQYRVILQSPSEALLIDKKASSTKDNEISSEIIDGKVQEDTHRIKINKGTSGWFLTTKKPLNLVNEEQASGILTFDLRVNKKSEKPIIFTTVCGNKCNVSFDMQDFFGKLAIGNWTTIGIPLKCLKQNGVNLKKITAPMGILSDGNWEFDIGKVYLEGGEGGKHIFPCN